LPLPCFFCKYQLCTAALDILFHLCSHFSITVNIGNPAKPYILDVDTGSDLTWLECNAPCRSCHKVQLVTQCCLLIVHNCIKKSILPYMGSTAYMRSPVIMVFMSERTLSLCYKKRAICFEPESLFFSSKHASKCCYLLTCLCVLPFASRFDPGIDITFASMFPT
jgi:hypothetical protein